MYTHNEEHSIKNMSMDLWHNNLDLVSFIKQKISIKIPWNKWFIYLNYISVYTHTHTSQNLLKIYSKNILD